MQAKAKNFYNSIVATGMLYTSQKYIHNILIQAQSLLYGYNCFLVLHRVELNLGVVGLSYGLPCKMHAHVILNQTCNKSINGLAMNLPAYTIDAIHHMHISLPGK